MKLNVPSIIEQMENYIQFRSIRFMFGCVFVNTSKIFEFIDKIYAELPVDIQIARKNGKDSIFQSDDLTIYDCLASLEQDLSGFTILGLSVVRLKDLKAEIDKIKQLYNTLI